MIVGIFVSLIESRPSEDLVGTFASCLNITCGCSVLTHKVTAPSVFIPGASLLPIYHGTRRKSFQYYSVLHQTQLMNR